MAVLPLISLCTGGAGLDSGIQLALASADVCPVLYVEREVPACQYLAAQMEAGRLAPAPIWSSVERLPDAGLEDLRELSQIALVGLSAGFPCQPFSGAGKGEGIDDPRWLWPAIDRWVSVVRPGVLFLENVPGLALRGLSHLATTLAKAGYLAEWDVFRAAETGAPHLRKRLFLVAVLPHAYGQLVRLLAERGNGSARPAEPRNAEPRDLGAKVAHAVGERCEWGGQLQTRQSDPDRSRAAMADSNSDGCKREPKVDRGDGRMEEQSGDHSHGCGPAFPSLYPPGPNDSAAWAHILRDRRFQHLAPGVSPKAVKSALRLLADGVGSVGRVALLRLAGNGVLPEQAALAYRSLIEGLGSREV